MNHYFDDIERELHYYHHPLPSYARKYNYNNTFDNGITSGKHKFETEIEPINFLYKIINSSCANLRKIKSMHCNIEYTRHNGNIINCDCKCNANIIECDCICINCNAHD